MNTQLHFTSMALLLSGTLLAQTTQPAGREADLRGPQSAEELIQFVQRAADRVKSQGEAAFDEFGRRPGQWNHGDTYIIVIDASTMKAVFHGADPKLQGKPLVTISGTAGRPIGRWINQSFEKGSKDLWVFYQWPEPTTNQPTWKATYYLRTAGPGSKEYIVASGVYNLPVDRTLVKEMVDQAAEWIQRDGKSALESLRDPKGPFVYKDTHVFVINTQGEVVADALYPDLQGKNQMDLKSSDGKPIQRDLVQLIETKGSGWSGPYAWPRPGTSAAGPKMIYIRKVSLGDQTLGVASGLYVDEQRQDRE